MFFCLLTMLYQCSFLDTHLSKDDLEWVNMYNVGDTLVYKSISNIERYNIIIVSKMNRHLFKNHPPITEDEVCELDFITDLELSTTLISGGGISDGTKAAILNILKFDEGAYCNMDTRDTTVQSVKLNNVYIYIKPSVKGDKSEPRELYWRKKDGIVAYVRQNGEMFVFYKKY